MTKLVGAEDAPGKRDGFGRGSDLRVAECMPKDYELLSAATSKDQIRRSGPIEGLVGKHSVMTMS